MGALFVITNLHVDIRSGSNICTSSYYLQYDYFSLVKATVVRVVGLLSMTVDRREDTSSVSKTFILGFSCRCFSSASTNQTR